MIECKLQFVPYPVHYKFYKLGVHFKTNMFAFNRLTDTVNCAVQQLFNNNMLCKRE